MRKCVFCRKSILKGKPSFRIPIYTTGENLRIWKRSAGISDDEHFSKSYRVCTSHFDIKYLSTTTELRLRLLPGAIPTINLRSSGVSTQISRVPELPAEMAEANYIEEDSEMDLLVPIVEKPAAPATPRILNKEFNSNSITATNNNINIVNGNNKFENIVTHFFEITYLPDDPSEKVRKEIVKKNIIIRTKPKPKLPNPTITFRTNLILNQSKKRTEPPSSRAAFRVRMNRERMRTLETPEESETRRKKERERKRLSRLKIRQRKLALEATEATESDNPQPSKTVSVAFPQGVNKITIQKFIMKNSEKENPENSQLKSTAIPKLPDVIEEIREDRRRANNRERQRRFRERRQGIAKQTTDGSSSENGSSAMGKGSGRSDEDEEIVCFESIPEFLL